jgi:hypothetical protein
MATVEIRFEVNDAAWFTNNPTKVLSDGEIAYRDDGKYKLGDGVTQLQNLTFYGGVSSSGLTIGTTTITSGTNTRVLYNNNGVVGEYAVTGTGNVVLSSELGNYQPLDADLTSWAGVTRAANFDTFVTTPSSANLRSLLTDENGTGAALFDGATSPTFTTSIITPNVTGVSGNLVFTNAAQSSGSITDYTFTKANHTGQTASTAKQGVLFTLGSRQWATGAITTQKEFELTSPTYSFVGASTITNAYSLYVNAPTAGTNATITNNYAAGFGGNVQIIPDSIGANGGFKFQALVSAPLDNCAIYCSTTSPSVSNFAFQSSTVTTTLNATSNVNIGISNGVQLAITTSAITVKNAVDLVFSGTTGTKIGTATTQKIGFWNATPIVQPTTAVTSATIVGGAGTTVKEDHTFDGYTIAKVVKALRNTGLLA